jgi:hypothetical protein
MAWWRGRRDRPKRGGRGAAGAGGVRTSLDREATPADLAHLRDFATTRAGVEFYVEPETTATDTTAVAVAADGEWTRRRVGSPGAIGKLARDLRLPVYEAAVVGYPKRMREYNERRKREGKAL